MLYLIEMELDWLSLIEMRYWKEFQIQIEMELDLQTQIEMVLVLVFQILIVLSWVFLSWMVSSLEIEMQTLIVLVNSKQRQKR